MLKTVISCKLLEIHAYLALVLFMLFVLFVALVALKLFVCMFHMQSKATQESLAHSNREYTTGVFRFRVGLVLRHLPNFLDMFMCD